MAISVKLLRTGTASTANTFVVTAGSGDSGKLQIQYNSSDIYNNLSGSTSDISSGSANSTITIPLNSSNEIPKGVYYFNFVADVGSSDTSTINFQVDSRDPLMETDADVYAPSFRVDDETSYTVDNGTVSTATRSLTTQYPSGSSQPNLSASASDTTTALYISTSNVWTGAMQTTLSYDVTYTIAATTGYDSFTYQESGTGYNSLTIDGTTSLDDVYDCINSLRIKMNNAAKNEQSNYAALVQDYCQVGALATQFRDAVVANKTSALNDIIAQIKKITKCEGSNSTAQSQASKKLYGIGGNSESIQDIVADMFTNGADYGTTATYNDTTAVIDLETDAIVLRVYNDTGSTISKGKAVYITNYSSAQGLPTIALASNASSASADAIGLVYADIASAASGRAVIHGKLEGVDTSSFTDGDSVFLSTSGNLTSTEPTADQYSQFIGTIVFSDTEGTVLVTPQKAVNYNIAISASSTISALQNLNRSASSAITDVTTLNGTPIQLLAGAGGRVIHLHSAFLVFTGVATQSADAQFQLATLPDSAAAYSAETVIMDAFVDSAVSSGSTKPFGVGVGQSAAAYGQVGWGLYLTAPTDFASWGGVSAKVYYYYTVVSV